MQQLKSAALIASMAFAAQASLSEREAPHQVREREREQRASPEGNRADRRNAERLRRKRHKAAQRLSYLEG